MFKIAQSIGSLFLFASIFACGSGSSTNPAAQTTLSFEDAPAADFELLFIGNSHSSVNNLPALVTRLIEAGTKGKTANGFNAPGWQFLDERVGDGVTQQSIEARPWTHIFLQAQKYSTTGQYYYSTSAAEEWVRKVKAVNATPVMFPEWPRRNNYEEGRRVYLLHVSIAETEPACVAPVGPAWDLARINHPEINLHASDGNHSSLKGALLTAFVFYEVITGNLASELSYVSAIDVSENEQNILRNIASEALQADPPCPLFPTN